MANFEATRVFLKRLIADYKVLKDAEEALEFFGSLEEGTKAAQEACEEAGKASEIAQKKEQEYVERLLIAREGYKDFQDQSRTERVAIEDKTRLLIIDKKKELEEEYESMRVSHEERLGEMAEEYTVKVQELEAVNSELATLRSALRNIQANIASVDG